MPTSQCGGPEGGAHSIWEVVLHLHSDYRLVLRRLGGDGTHLTEFIISILALPTMALAQITSDQRPSDFDMQANARFEIATWKEEPFSPVEAGDKLTRASVVKSYSGDIEGEGRLEYLMRYRGDGSAEFFGFERFIGNVKGASGSFILRHTGTFQGGEMTQMSTVLAGSGTGELAGLTGEVQHTAGHQQVYPFELEYTLE